MSNITNLKRAAEQHLSPNAQYLMGLMALYGQDTPDLNAAKDWFSKAAAQKYALAQSHLQALKTAADRLCNLAELQQAAQKGYSHAQFDLSQLYCYGWSVEQDFAQCFKWLQLAAGQGCPYAQYLFGLVYLDGEGVKENAEEGFKWIHRAAEQDYAHAQWYLADCYLYDRRIEHSHAKAIEWVSKAVQQDYSQAQCLLGLIYEMGWGVKKDKSQARALYQKAVEQGNLQGVHRIADLYRMRDDNEQALIWYQRAAEGGYELSQYDLAKMLEYADGIPHDYAKACYWLEKSAEQGNELAAINLAEHYATGSGVERDESKASYWYLQAAKLGYDDAQYQIGQRYEQGNGIEKDFKQAEYWYRLAAKQGHYHAKQEVGNIREFKRYLKAAKTGDTNAQCKVGECYTHGYGTGQDLAQALHWYQAAAEQGNAEACFALGQCYEQGKGVEKDEQQALNWYRKAVDGGSEKAKEHLAELNALEQNDPQIHYELGRRYYWGMEDKPRDREKAFEHYLAAAEQGHAEATLRMAELYHDEDDHPQALAWYHKAAERGDEHAPYRLGMFYDSSEKEDCGVAKDDAKAIHYYQQAAERGSLEAQLLLAKRYTHGQGGLPKDEARALYWYEQAARQDDEEAQFILGRCYAEGRGVAQDLSQARHWLGEAAEQGHRKAREYLETLQDKEQSPASENSEDDIDAQYQLGLAYDYGRGVERDFVRAVKHYRNAAERGHADAQFEMGNMCAFAQGTEHSENEALNWYLKAALQGHKDAQKQLRGIIKFQKIAEAALQGDADAQYELAHNYYYGHDAFAIKKDPVRAFSWYLQAAELGHPEAQSAVIGYYEEGEHIGKDPAKALYWLNKAAEQGHEFAIERLKEMEQSKALRQAAETGDIEAIYRLAWLYQHGRGVAFDHTQAAHWYEKAAVQGHSDAQYQLGRIYKEGLGGMERDIEKALYWFKQAAEQNHALAADFIFITAYNQAQGNYDKPRATEVEPPHQPKTQEVAAAQSPLWYSAEQLPLLKKALNTKPPAAPPQIRAIQQKALDTVLRCAEKLSGEFADKHVEMVKLGMRALRKEADQYDAPDEFTLEHPMFDELSAELRKVRDEEGAFALHCLIDRSKYKIYEDYEPDNSFGVSVHCEAYYNICWLDNGCFFAADDATHQPNHRAVFKGTPTAAELGFTHDFVYGEHNPFPKRDGMDELDIWTAAAPIRGSNGKIVAIVEAHILAPELQSHPQWNASR